MNADLDWFKFATYNWTYLKKATHNSSKPAQSLVRAGTDLGLYTTTWEITAIWLA